MGDCSCGASSAAPNFECERCRLVYFVLAVKTLQDKQAAYARNRSPDFASAAADAGARVAKMVDKFCEQPKQQELLPDAGHGSYYGDGA
jgi:hypothetical protein